MGTDRVYVELTFIRHSTYHNLYCEKYLFELRRSNEVGVTNILFWNSFNSIAVLLDYIFELNLKKFRINLPNIFFARKMSITIKTVDTKPYEGQKPGTSGLRKKVLFSYAVEHLHFLII